MRRLLPSHRDTLGQLACPVGRNRIYPGVVYAADNAAFSGFDAGKFVLMLHRLSCMVNKPLWVSAPDVLCDAAATASQWLMWRARIECYGLRPAYVLQDGQERFAIPWSPAYFVGGSTSFKLSRTAAMMVRSLKRDGAMIHMGRVNTLDRVRYARDIGCDTIDGTAYSRWGDIFIPRCLDVLEEAMHTTGSCGT